MLARAAWSVTRSAAKWGLILLVSLLWASGLSGQDDPGRADGRVEVGDTVRFTRMDSVVRGTIVRMDGGTWEMDVDAPDAAGVTLGPDSIGEIQVLAGRGRKILGGLGIGLLVGGASGAVVGLATASEDSILSENAQIGLSTLFMGGIGLLVGGIVGAIPRDRWEEVSPPPSGVQLTAAPVSDGAILTAAVRF